MSTIARSVYLDSEFGLPQELPRAGTALENPYVFDASARELRAMASQGLIEVLSEHVAQDGNEILIDHFRFRRLR